METIFNMINILMLTVSNTSVFQYIFANLAMYNTTLTMALVILIVTLKLLVSHRILILEKSKIQSIKTTNEKIMATTVRSTNRDKGVYDIHTFNQVTDLTGFKALQAGLVEVKSMRKDSIRKVF